MTQKTGIGKKGRLCTSNILDILISNWKLTWMTLRKPLTFQLSAKNFPSKVSWVWATWIPMVTRQRYSPCKFRGTTLRQGELYEVPPLFPFAFAFSEPVLLSDLKLRPLGLPFPMTTPNQSKQDHYTDCRMKTGHPGEVRGLHCCESPRAPKVGGEGKEKQHPSLLLGNSSNPTSGCLCMYTCTLTHIAKGL